jgi:hypothetical protein
MVRWGYRYQATHWYIIHTDTTHLAVASLSSVLLAEGRAQVITVFPHVIDQLTPHLFCMRLLNSLHTLIPNAGRPGGPGLASPGVVSFSGNGKTANHIETVLTVRMADVILDAGLVCSHSPGFGCRCGEEHSRVSCISNRSRRRLTLYRAPLVCTHIRRVRNNTRAEFSFPSRN